MDGETSYESDISESWSLIDINLNEESLSAAEAYSELEKSSQPDLKADDKLQAVSERELEEFVRKCRETNKTDFNRISDSDSDASCKNQQVPTCDLTKTDRGDSPSKRSSDNDGLHDSGDAESIEILDMDGNYDDSEIDRLGVDHLDFPTYHSDDEESSEGKIDNESRNSNSAVIKRRKRRGNKSSEPCVHTVNSENRSSGEYNSTHSSSDAGNDSRGSSKEANISDGHPVYKHYRNNVANTILSLSVGVIFAGVACIAIGHFLGVQDAAETAVELVETLKKLQVENAALQSRLSHLNRALLTREMNSKLELPVKQPQQKAANDPAPCVDLPSKDKQTDLNNAALSEIRSSLNSIEWLSRIQNLVQKNNKATDTEYGVDFTGFGKFIHDQLHTLNARQEEGAKILEDTDRKMSKVLNKIVNRLSSSQDHIEKLYEKLIKLKNKLNHKIKRIFPEPPEEVQSGKSNRRVPVTELDLQTMQWNSDNEIDLANPVLYKFPQPEDYYERQDDSKETGEKDIERTNSTSIYKKKDVGSQEEEKKKRKKEKRDEKKAKDNWKKKKFKEKEPKEKKAEKKRKRTANKSSGKGVKKTENGQKNKIRFNEPRHKKFTHNQNVFNETISPNKIHPKMEEKKDATGRLRFKKSKHSKLQKVLLSKLRKGHSVRNPKKKHYSPGYGCFNTTGHWVFKWAGGREEIRRHETLGDWQFERAKVRKELREEDLNNNWQFERAKVRKELREEDLNDNWQFERAKARKELREEDDDDHNKNWQFKRAMARESNRNDVRWHRGKYAGKDFFHEGFSWI